MKKPRADVVLLAPDLTGWRLDTGTGTEPVPDLAAAVALLPTTANLHLALPAHIALLERLTLPTTDAAELGGMVLLQLEKTLPYPVEEVTTTCESLGQTGTDSAVLSIAVHGPALEELCAPFRAGDHLPRTVTLWAQHVARACPAEETILAVWGEHGQAILAVCERSRLGWLHILPDLEPGTLSAELPSMLLGAELAGVPTEYARILLAGDLPLLEAPLAEAFSLPVEPLSLTAIPVPEGNLVPPAWQADARRVQRSESFRQRLMLAAVLYLVLLAGAFVYLALTKRKVQAIDAQLAVLQPQIAAVQAQQAHWQALSPAVDPTRYPVEVLFQASQNLPSPEVRITTFNYTPSVFTIKGEAPNANLAIEYTQKLRAVPELSAWRIEAGPPSFLPDNRAQFTITGRL